MMLKMPSRMMFWTVLLLPRNVWKADPAWNQLDIPEMLAKVMAHRHLEDARMRLGKAVQAFDGCKSAYDK